LEANATNNIKHELIASEFVPILKEKFRTGNYLCFLYFCCIFLAKLLVLVDCLGYCRYLQELCVWPRKFKFPLDDDVVRLTEVENGFVERFV